MKFPGTHTEPIRTALMSAGSEIMALSNSASSKNIFIGGFDLRGTFDYHAFHLALSESLRAFPEVVSRVEEASSGKGLAWVPPPPDFEPVIQREHAPDGSSCDSFEDWFMQRMVREAQTDWDILNVMPSKFFLFEVAPGHERFLSASHHASLDGWTMLGFLKTILENYHRNVTGEECMEGKRAPWATSQKDQSVSVSGGLLRHALFAFRQGAAALGAGAPALPRGKGVPGSSGEHWAKIMLSEDETELTVRAAASAGIAYVDMLSTALIRAVDLWNDVRGFPRRTALVGLPVQMRGRSGPEDAAVNFSFVLVTAKSENRDSVQHLAEAVANSRRAQFRQAADVRIARAGDALLNFFRLFPLNLRRRITHGFWRLPFAPMLISSGGVLWPTPESSGPVKRSALSGVGDLEVSEVHVMGYKHTPNTRLRLFVFTFRGRLNVLLWTADSLLSPDEARDFSDLLKTQFTTVADILRRGGDTR